MTDNDKPFDCCGYIKQCTDNPFATAPQITIGQWRQLLEHVLGCATCSKSVEDIVKKYPDDPLKKGGHSEN